MIRHVKESFLHFTKITADGETSGSDFLTTLSRPTGTRGVMDQESHLSSEEEVGEPSVIIGLVLSRFQHAVVLWFSRAKRRLLQGFTVFSTVLLLLWIAAFLYGTFYYSYMPKAAFSAPVYYYYRTDCESPSAFWCSYPVANVSLMTNRKHVLTFGQVYRMYLQLEMPDSPTNHEVGMFMIKTTCFSQDGGQVASSARTASQLQKASSSRFGMLRYRSDLLNTLGTLLFLPAFLSGAAEQKQVVEVELFSEFTDDPYSPSVMAVIEILSSKVQIYSSHLFVHAHFTGLRYLLFYYPVLSALIGVATNFTFLSFLFLLSYMRQLLRLPQSPEQITTDDLQPLDEKDLSADAAERLGPLQTDPTDMSGEERHLERTNTDMQNGHTQSDMSQSEAA
ncbi:seipin-like isoform X1 [Poecilia latipinna]|uniref:Seipin n=2 Tax=Poecilia TaxID=8080 RepID=A0A3B3V175_9TELE|nr:PREDICTED: seipin-like isoform X1 [Poecilia latipinna]XP_014873369.1 PREDICTED: seipin-like isoform X1 [Poecilia latipinna]